MEPGHGLPETLPPFFTACGEGCVELPPHLLGGKEASNAFLPYGGTVQGLGIVCHDVDDAIGRHREVGLDPAGPLGVGSGFRTRRSGRPRDQEAARIIGEVEDAALSGGNHGDRPRQGLGHW